MANALTKIPSKIAESFKKMTKGQKVRLFVLIAIIIAILIVISVVLNQKNYVVVFTGSAADAGDVMTALNDLGVTDYKTQGTGTILVEESVATNVKMELAAQGYPSSGFNNEIFQNAAGLGVTDMEKRKYWQMQLQEYIKQLILQMDKVDNAMVLLDLGQDSSYVISSDETKPTASVTLTLKNNQKLTESEAKAIAETVTGAVSGMAAEDVRIVDSQMNVYSSNGDDAMSGVDTQMGLQDAYQSQMQAQVINLLSAVVGEENVKATVNVKLNFDSKTTESVEFTPPEGSTEGLEENVKELVEEIKNNANGNVAGIDANGTASQYLAALNEDADNSVYYQASKEANYALNKTTKQIEEAKGKFEELSISVIINSEAVDDYSEEFKQLVATAIGVDQEHITVMSLPFAPVDDTAVQDALNEQQSMLDSMQSAETTRLMIILGTVLVVMIFLFMIFRMFKKKTEPVPAEGGFEYIADEEIIPGQERMPQASFDEIKLEDFEKTDNKLTILEDYIGMNPESVANLLRNWLNED